MQKKMRILTICVVLLLFANGCGILMGQRSRDGDSRRRRSELWQENIIAPYGNFVVGESLEYRVRWLGLDVGQASLTVNESSEIPGKKTYHIKLTASTNKFFSFFYKVKTKVESYIDVKTLKPIRYRSTSKINEKFVFKRVDYDYKKKIAHSIDKKGEYDIEIDDDVLDPLGIFYYFRFNPVKLSEAINFVVNSGKKSFPITVFIRKGKRMKLRPGVFWAFLVEPAVSSERQFDDILNAPGKMWIWFSADERRIPLIIALKIPVGTAQAILVKSHFPVKPELTKKK